MEEKWTESELLDMLRKTVKEPEIYSIKEVARKLLDIESVEYYHLLTELFLKAETLYSKDTSKLKVSLSSVQKAIVGHIASKACTLDSPYFEILQNSAIGAEICQRKKGGMKATEILSRKVLQASGPDQISRFMYNLAMNVNSSNELKYLNGIKIYETVNSNIDSLVQQEDDLFRIC